MWTVWVVDSPEYLTPQKQNFGVRFLNPIGKEIRHQLEKYKKVRTHIIDTPSSTYCGSTDLCMHDPPLYCKVRIMVKRAFGPRPRSGVLRARSYCRERSTYILNNLLPL